MGSVIITLKVMPITTSVDLDKLAIKEQKKVKIFSGNEGEVKIEPVAFGLKSIRIVFAYDENKGDTEPLEKEIMSVDGVNSVDVVDVRRAIG